ncbi:MAG: hypothetical protein ABSC06_20145 [Rhodopila sp.]|jgi:hypothetical protein
MPLDDTGSRTKPKLVALGDARTELDRALAALLPRAKTVRDKLALDYWAASEAARLDDAWREKAKRGAVAGGVLPDYTANPLPVGTSETVYSSPLLTIGLKVVRQADRVNVAGLVAYLEQAGVKPALLRRAVKRNSEQFGGAHIFTVLLQQAAAAPAVTSGRRATSPRVASA